MAVSLDVIQNSIDAQEVIDLARRLVILPSENPPGNESPVAHLLGDYLSAAGFAVGYQAISAGRENVVARLGKGEKGLLYCGHSDTMPVSGKWTVDPHGAEIRDGRLYGRGSADMKGGLAAMASACAAVARSGARLKGALTFAAVVDEENQGVGAVRLVESGVRANWAVIGEPTGNAPVIASNGQINFSFHFFGQAGHASSPWKGRNAVYDGLRLVNALQWFAEEVLPGRRHPLTGSASLNVGTITGGVQTSIIPDTCHITVDRRVAPGESVEQAVKEIEAIVAILRRENPALQVTMDIPYSLPPVVVDEDAAVVRALRESAKVVCGADPGTQGMRATTDAATLAGKGGIPPVVFGPGSIDQAHREDEYLTVSELVDAARIYARAALWLLGQEDEE